GERSDETATDKSSGARHKYGLPTLQLADQLCCRSTMQARQSSRRSKIAQTEHAYADGGRGRKGAEQSVFDKLDSACLPGPRHQNRQQKTKDRAVIEREQRVVDALAGG